MIVILNWGDKCGVISTLVTDCKCKETIGNLQTVNLALVREEGPINSKLRFCGFSEEARRDRGRGGGLLRVKCPDVGFEEQLTADW